MEPPMKRRKLRSFPYFSTLPDEISCHIFNYLDVVSKLRLKRVSRKWNSLMEGTLDTIKLDERWFTKFNLHLQERLGIDSFYANLQVVHRYLEDLWDEVKCVIVDGDYDMTDDKPTEQDDHCTERSGNLASFLLKRIADSEYSGWEAFPKLNTVVLRRVPLSLTYLGYLLRKVPLHIRLVVCESPLVIEHAALHEEWDSCTSRIEFAVEECKVFDLTREAVVLKSKLQIVKDEDEDDVAPRMDRVFAEFIVEQCNAIKDEDVSQLGDLYANLLRGREGMVIRRDLVELFKCIFECDIEGNKRPGYVSSRKHWQQCRGYDFKRLDKMSQAALIYYTNKRNCYRLAQRPLKGERKQL